MRIKKENSAKFTWERWGGRYFGLTDVIVFNEETEQYNLLNNVIKLGYIESNKLPVRPRKYGFALLFKFNDDDEIYWIHCPEFGMKEILNLNT